MLILFVQHRIVPLFGFFLCFRQTKLSFSIATSLVIIKIIFSSFTIYFVLTDCRSRPGLFCTSWRCSSASRQKNAWLLSYASASSHATALHRISFYMALSIMFYHAILFSWLRILRLRFCASFSALVFCC